MAGSTDSGLIPLYTTQFSTNLELLLQQMGSKLRGKVREGFHVGKMASPINQIGAVSLKAPAGRFAPKNRSDSEFDRPWVFPQEGEIDQLIDSFDELQTIVDPKSQYTENAANAVGRGWDDCLIANACATRQVGQDAASLTSKTFSTANFQISVSFGAASASGLTVAKFIEAKRILRKYHNDLERDPPTMVIGSNQEADLLNQVQVVSTEFNDRPVLVDGNVKRFLGFEIEMSERLPYNVGAANQRGCFAFVKSGMYLGIWKDLTNRVSIRNELSGEPYDLWTSTMFGSTRTQEGKVVQILSADTTGADITP
jgi:Phage capsid protein